MTPRGKYKTAPMRRKLQHTLEQLLDAHWRNLDAFICATLSSVTMDDPMIRFERLPHRRVAAAVSVNEPLRSPRPKLELGVIQI